MYVRIYNSIRIYQILNIIIIIITNVGKSFNKCWIILKKGICLKVHSHRIISTISIINKYYIFSLEVAQKIKIKQRDVRAPLTIYGIIVTFIWYGFSFFALK